MIQRTWPYRNLLGIGNKLRCCFCSRGNWLFAAVRLGTNNVSSAATFIIRFLSIGRPCQGNPINSVTGAPRHGPPPIIPLPLFALLPFLEYINFEGGLEAFLTRVHYHLRNLRSWFFWLTGSWVSRCLYCIIICLDILLVLKEPKNLYMYCVDFWYCLGYCFNNIKKLIKINFFNTWKWIFVLIRLM